MKKEINLNIWEQSFIQRYGEEKLSLLKSLLENTNETFYDIAKVFNVSREAARQWSSYYGKTGKERIKDRQNKKLLEQPFKIESLSLFSERARNNGFEVKPILSIKNLKDHISLKTLLINEFKCVPKKLISPSTTGGCKKYYRVVRPTGIYDFLCLIGKSSTYILPYSEIKKNNSLMLYIPVNEISSWSHIDWNKYKEAWNQLKLNCVPK